MFARLSRSEKLFREGHGTQLSHGLAVNRRSGGLTSFHYNDQLSLQKVPSTPISLANSESDPRSAISALSGYNAAVSRLCHTAALATVARYAQNVFVPVF